MSRLSDIKYSSKGGSMPLGTFISSRSAFKNAVLIYNRCMSHLKSTARAISVLNIVVVLEVGENLAQK